MTWGNTFHGNRHASRITRIDSRGAELCHLPLASPLIQYFDRTTAMISLALLSPDVLVNCLRKGENNWGICHHRVTSLTCEIKIWGAISVASMYPEAIRRNKRQMNWCRTNQQGVATFRSIFALHPFIYLAANLQYCKNYEFLLTFTNIFLFRHASMEVHEN